MTPILAITYTLTPECRWDALAHAFAAAPVLGHLNEFGRPLVDEKWYSASTNLL